ncbi:hypothetical protein E1B28_007900 [Marasmius oreades]|uniref:Uncharacterized protein n=1 Tax=Marasmius oreades TaxID=181124 RepID=A0A9P7S2I5_9AGAR|nr:uncharacterized protein E1B28_007900 [Marasmius oreades]KAG7094299.1 hypothetical protein E1B28_007900 [Marasmius oreades]
MYFQFWPFVWNDDVLAGVNVMQAALGNYAQRFRVQVTGIHRFDEKNQYIQKEMIHRFYHEEAKKDSIYRGGLVDEIFVDARLSKPFARKEYDEAWTQPLTPSSPRGQEVPWLLPDQAVHHMKKEVPPCDQKRLKKMVEENRIWCLLDYYPRSETIHVPKDLESSLV